ncbi:MAG: hypothetical protein A2275_05390 [Bacteroidetes bacterium RIFOXYA12_FULL_35_11]|nr:MAG: hypothetical protein A2X01_10740 [Bacteroidetes bacterium GWF2_35_48]OFY73823.1 MAG: hypothetical protein A2275_05390 [Bacteroidetes bacterium RIFOXYA12_FULL_35_11]HBX50417.1 hypothetical protein [Bacteroidales bacterium]
MNICLKQQPATCNLGFDSLPTLPRRQAGGQAGAQPAVILQPSTFNLKSETLRIWTHYVKKLKN